MISIADLSSGVDAVIIFTPFICVEARCALIVYLESVVNPNIKRQIYAVGIEKSRLSARSNIPP